MTFGYARVSTTDQNLDRQIEAWCHFHGRITNL